jgi:hypothetical protein
LLHQRRLSNLLAFCGFVSSLQCISISSFQEWEQESLPRPLETELGVSSDDSNLDRIRPLLDVVFNNVADEIIWDKVCDAVTDQTPPGVIRPAKAMTTQHEQLRELDRTPQIRRRHTEGKAGVYVRQVPDFFDAFFREAAGFEAAAQAMFEGAKKGTIRSTGRRAAGKAGSATTPGAG